MKLAALQQEFCDLILDDAAPDEAIFGTDAETRFGIYRSAYRSRLIDCLRNCFEKTWSWIGDEAFDTAARQHAILNPPSSWTLDDYGMGFDVTLATLFPDDPEIAELAWLEWAMQNAFASVDQNPVTLTDVQAYIAEGGDMDAAGLTFVNSLCTAPIRTNCTEIWQAIADQRTPPPSVIYEITQHIRVWRKGFSPHFRICNAGEAEALATMAGEATFGTLCAALDNSAGREAAIETGGTLLGMWLGDELVAGLS